MTISGPLRLLANVPRRVVFGILLGGAILFLIVYQFLSLKHSLENSIEKISKSMELIVQEPSSSSGQNLESCQLLKAPPDVKYTGPVDERIETPTDKSPYKGPIVEGWGPEVSRDVRLYVRPSEDTTLLFPTNLGNDPNWCQTTKLFIFQHSRPSNFAIRLDNRRTWMNYIKEYPHMKAIFVVGRPSGENADSVQEKIAEEHNTYGDILQVDYIEHANNNTLKTILALKYIFTVDWAGHYPEFVMKSDDDVYINLPLLSKILFENNDYRSSSTQKAMASKWPPLMGHLFITPPVLEVEAEKMDTEYTEYLICPKYMYSKKNYPTFTSGTGYIVPWWAVPCFYQESLRLPYFFIEDVHMGGFVADRCLMPKKELSGFSPGRKEVDEVRHDQDLLIHYMDHEYKYNIHKKITDGHNSMIQL